MIQITMLLTRRADLSHEQFVDYWTKKHTPKIAAMPNTTAVATKYVQLLPTADTLPGVNMLPCDAIAEVWVDSVEDAKTLFMSEQYQNVVGKDEENFLDRSKTQFFFATEHMVVG